jgi:hypothetical protein
VQRALVFDEAQLQIVELLDHLAVARVGERARDVDDQPDGTRDKPRLFLRLREHTVDLAADGLADRAMRGRAAGKAAFIADPAAREVVRVELGAGGFEIFDEKRRMRRIRIAREVREVAVELFFEAGWIDLTAPARLHAFAQRLEQGVEVGRLGHEARMYRSSVRRAGLRSRARSCTRPAVVRRLRPVRHRRRRPGRWP